jgi:hypothetical protein
VSAESTAHAEFHGYLLHRVVQGVEQLLDLVLGESYLLAVVVVIVFGVHARNVRGTGHKPPNRRGFPCRSPPIRRQSGRECPGLRREPDTDGDISTISLGRALLIHRKIVWKIGSPI